MTTVGTTPSNGTAPPDVPDELRQEVQDFTSNLTGRLAGLDAEIEQHQAAIAELQRKRRWINGILKAVSPETQTSAPKRNKSSSGPKEVSPKVLLRVLDQVAQTKENEKFTVIGLHEILGEPWSDSQTRFAVEQLRRHEVIGKAGRTEGRHPRNLYRILDHAAGERLRQTLTNQTGE